MFTKVVRRISWLQFKGLASGSARFAIFKAIQPQQQMKFVEYRIFLIFKSKCLLITIISTSFLCYYEKTLCISFPRSLNIQIYAYANSSVLVKCRRAYQQIYIYYNQVVMGNNCTICDEPEAKPKINHPYPEERPLNPVNVHDQQVHHRPSSTKNDQKYFKAEQPISRKLDFGQDTRQKRAPVTFKSGIIYDGQWKGNNRDGYGVQTWPDGARYQGQWKDNKANGKGKFIHVDGDIYQGQWKQDKANGFGVYIHSNGALYEGYWKDDHQDGHGLQKWVDGSHYEGSYKNGKKNGQGHYSWADGSYYKGNWVNNKITGYGVYCWTDGRKYQGDWLQNQMHGKGTYTWRDGRKYQGEYQYDKKHGYGVYTWADGRKYDGSWANGLRNGRGKYIMKNGVFREGIWQNDKRIRWLDEANQNQFNEMSQIRTEYTKSNTKSPNSRTIEKPS